MTRLCQVTLRGPFTDSHIAIRCRAVPVGLSAMAYEKAAADLDDYMRHVSECQRLPVLTKERRGALKNLKIEATRVNRILASLIPGHAPVVLLWVMVVGDFGSAGRSGSAV